MKKTICLLLACSVFFAGCAGREANPIPAYLPGDNERSCNVLVAEIAQLQADMQRLLPKTNKGVTNTLWATAGVFLIVPFFFMDLKDAEKIEFDAMRTRHNRLLLICADKGCDMTGVRAERVPSAKEAKEMPKKAKKEAENPQSKEETKTISQKDYEEYQRYLEEQKNNESQTKNEK
jgi:hypothetical protein